MMFAVRLLPPALLALPAWAQNAASPPELGSGIGQLLLGLIVVLALIVSSLWVLKRLSAPRGQSANLLKVIAGTAVGARERVVILEIGGTWLVLGVAPGRVTPLAEIPRGELPPAEPGQDFASRLRQLVAHRHAD